MLCDEYKIYLARNPYFQANEGSTVKVEDGLSSLGAIFYYFC